MISSVSVDKACDRQVSQTSSDILAAVSDIFPPAISSGADRYSPVRCEKGKGRFCAFGGLFVSVSGWTWGRSFEPIREFMFYIFNFQRMEIKSPPPPLRHSPPRPSFLPYRSLLRHFAAHPSLPRQISTPRFAAHPWVTQGRVKNRGEEARDGWRRSSPGLVGGGDVCKVGGSEWPGRKRIGRGGRNGGGSQAATRLASGVVG